MDAYLSIIESGDLCSLGFVILLLAAVGGRMVDKWPRLRVVGWQLAAGVFVLYGAYAVTVARTTDTGELAMILVRAVLAGGLTLGLAWVLLPFITFLVQYLGLSPLAKARSAFRALYARRTSKNDELGRLRAELDRRNAELQSAKKDGQQARETNRTSREAQRRRDNARASCELLFVQYASELEQRFPRMVFERFVADYMGDDRSPDEVEQRAEQLRNALCEQRRILNPARRFSSLAELAAWYQNQQLQVRNAGLDPDITEVQLIALEGQYDDLLRRFIQES